MGNTTKIIAEPEKQELFNIRKFDAPQELVFKAFTDPDLYSQWYGPGGGIMNIETFEPKNGSSWRYVLRESYNRLYELLERVLKLNLILQLRSNIRI